MRKLYVISVIFFISVFTLFSGCTQEDIGIFYSLEIESEREGDLGLGDELKGWEMTMIGSTYYIASGKVFYRPADSSVNWAEIDSPAEDMLCSDIAAFLGTLYAVFRTVDGTLSHLYRLVDASANAWARVGTEGSIFYDSRIVSVLQLHNTLFVSAYAVASGSEYDQFTPYSLWFTKDGAAFGDVQLNNITFSPDDISLRSVFDGIWDGTNYWLITGDVIYLGPDNPAALSFSEVASSAAEYSGVTDMGGIYYSPHLDLIFLSSKSEYIYIRENSAGAAWVQSIPAEDESFYDFSYIDAPDTIPDEKVSSATKPYPDDVVIVAGSDTGYYEVLALTTETVGEDTYTINSGFSDNPLSAVSIRPRRPSKPEITTDLNYLNTNLSNGTILRFFVDQTEADIKDHRTFACTASNGLWQNRYSAEVQGVERVWTRE